MRWKMWIRSGGWTWTCLVLTAVMLALAILTACQLRRDVDVNPMGFGDPQRGREAITAHGCAACHVVPGVRGADSPIGPPLDDWADRWYIAGRLINEPPELIRWIQAPQSIDPGNAMPDMGVPTDDAEDIAAHLYTLRRTRRRVSPNWAGPGMLAPGWLGGFRARE
jgi:cytochrome c